MTETFLFVRLGEREVWWNVAWKLQKCREGVGGGDVDIKPDCTFFKRKIWNIHIACLLVSLC